MKVSKHFYSLLVFGLFFLFSRQLRAQSVITPENIGMGGGGVTYITGYTSNFINPANLLIPDHKYETQVGIGQIGLFLNDKPLQTPKYPLQSFYDVFSPGNHQLMVNNSTQFSSTQNIDAINSWFPDKNQVYGKKAVFNALLFGLSWQKKHHAFSLAIRTRGVNRMEIGRGWYDSNFVDVDTTGTIDRSVHQTIAVYHEISLGYAQELSLINGWTSQLNRLYFGIAPKLILAGMYFDGQYNSQYINNSTGLYNTRSFDGVSTGALSNNISTYLSSTKSYSTPLNTLNTPDLAQPTGIGFGLDMGFTYIMALGNDIALLRQKNDPVLKRSFRISVSVTDIGYVRYNKNVKHYYYKPTTDKVNSVPAVPHSDFTGSPGMFSRFIAPDNPNGTAYNNANLLNQNRIDVSLPTALHIGSALQLPLFIATVDFTYALNQQTFNEKSIVTNIGGELHILHFLPIRAGVQLEKGYDPIFGFGVGLNFPHFEISAGTQLNTAGVKHNSYIIGAGIAALQLRF